MKKTPNSMRSACRILVMMLCGAGLAAAQVRVPAPRAGSAAGERRGREVLRLRKMEWRGNDALVRTPEYRTSETRGLKRAGEWYRLSVAYETEPEWIDELIFQYYVLAMTAGEGGENRYSFYRARVTYVDVAEGDHVSTVFLRPATLERFGRPVAAAVQILHEGTVVAQTSDATIRLPEPETWWEDKRVVEKEGVTVRDGLLLNRSQTPFALVDIDAYEVIR